MSNQVEAWIGLGSNLEKPLQQLASAITDLTMLPRSSLLSQSPFYRSRPMGPQDQPDFINGVALLHTSLPAQSLLDELQRLEQQHGRVRGRHWGPRTLDLDLLLYGRETIDTDRLTVPHPGIADRDFVLRPMLDINPDLALPNGQRLEQLLTHCSDSHLQRLEPPLASPPPRH